MQLPSVLRPNYIQKVDNNYPQDLPILKEWAYDFEHNQFLLNENGEQYLVEKNEALKIWMYWAIITERYQWRANTRRYGSEIERMIGLPVSVAIKSSELQRTVKEALEYCPYIKEIKDINVSLVDDVVTLSVTVISIYTEGAVRLNVEI